MRTRRSATKRTAHRRESEIREVLEGLGYDEISINTSVRKSSQPMGGVYDYFAEYEIEADGRSGSIADSRDGWSASHGSGRPVNFDVDTVEAAVRWLFGAIDLSGPVQGPSMVFQIIGPKGNRIGRRVIATSHERAAQRVREGRPGAPSGVYQVLRIWDFNIRRVSVS